MSKIPQTQRAVQLTGPDQLKFNAEKPVFKAGPYQILGKIEAVGLCFSDLKLLKQFTSHARKSPIKSGIDAKVLAEIPSYVPEDKPTVPGHETVIRIVEMGERVSGFKLGQRCLVQSDYRWLPTASSNAAFGYNFEGGLQEYVLMDQRVITSPTGDSMLIPAAEHLSASAVALVEPWACVENAYASKDRRTLKAGGKTLVVATAAADADAFKKLFEQYGMPGSITWVGGNVPQNMQVPVSCAGDVKELPDASFDDIIYFGSDCEAVESLFAKLAALGMINIVQCGGKFGRAVVTAVGRVHYGGIRIIGTAGNDPCESMKTIPASGEIRKGDKINVIGAGGPMGVMHVVRNLCQGVPDVTVYAGDLDDTRLASLTKIAAPLGAKNKTGYQPYNPSKGQGIDAYDYYAVMAPVPAIVAKAVEQAATGAIINIFAGIAAHISGNIDLDAYISKKLYFVGTSGSVLDDMKLVLAKVESGRLDTNISVAAVCGLEDAIEGIRAVEKALIPGKIVVYPSCKGLGLVKLEELSASLPRVSEKLEDGNWNSKAEQELLSSF